MKPPKQMKHEKQNCLYKAIIAHPPELGRKHTRKFIKLEFNTTEGQERLMREIKAEIKSKKPNNYSQSAITKKKFIIFIHMKYSNNI